jgi:nucleotide-binding universal stress UspA family protein
MLQRHSIAAMADVGLVAGGEADESLISTMFGLNCDLLVMGCYGHSRLRETVFGGASQRAFDEAWVPILMSH